MGVGLIERYRERLALAPGTPAVSLGEGSTPLLHAPRLSARLGIELWLKWEGANPTGSFKDRGMCVAVSQALAEGAGAVICASTGNTAASAAAYAARAGLRAIVLEPEGAVALGKLAQARAAGATVLAVRGSFDQALAAARELGDARHPRPRQLGQPVPDRGPEDGRVRDRRGARPRAGRARAPLRRRRQHPRVLQGLLRARARCRASSRASRRSARTTLASAIRISEPAHAAEVAEAVAASDGTVLTVSDEQIVEAWRLLAHEEGVFCEPASAAPARRAAHRGAPAGDAGRLRRHRARPQGHRGGRPDGAAAGHRRRRPGRDRGGRAVTIRVRAPATTANLGPGFDCAGGRARALERAGGGARAASPTGSTSASRPSPCSPRPTGARSRSRAASRASGASARARR